MKELPVINCFCQLDYKSTNSFQEGALLVSETGFLSKLVENVSYYNANNYFKF